VTFRKILCPVDFSPPSESALEAAVALAAQSGGRVTVLHVVEMPDPLLEKSEFLEWITRRYEAQLKEFMQRHACPEVDEHALLREGSPAREINRAVEGLGSDVVVLGTHGRTGLKRLLIGSVAERVVRTSSVPVLTVPSGAPEGDASTDEAERGHGDPS